jgi:hypothetical protein
MSASQLACGQATIEPIRAVLRCAHRLADRDPNSDRSGLAAIAVSYTASSVLSRASGNTPTCAGASTLSAKHGRAAAAELRTDPATGPRRGVRQS